MSRRWTLHILGKIMSPAQMEDLCGRMKLADGRTEYIIRRFCRGHNLFQCEDIGPGYSESDQRRFMPDLDIQISSWLQKNPHELTEEQRVSFYSWLITGKAYRGGKNPSDVMQHPDNNPACSESEP